VVKDALDELAERRCAGEVGTVTGEVDAGEDDLSVA
jgi:hypothetical protein